MATLDTVRLSRNNKAQWTSLNPILSEQEIGFETDTKLFKIGNGVTSWNNLAYVVSGGQNALFVFLSSDQNNLIAATTEGGLFLDSRIFNGVADYNSGKEQGPTALTPAREFNVTMVKIGQDVYNINKTITTMLTRIALAEAIVPGVKIDDTSATATTTTLSSKKINDNILVSINDLKNKITANAGGAYDALNRLAALLDGNSSIATTFATELAGTIRFDIIQQLTVAQKLQARTNIDAVGISDIGDILTVEAEYTAGKADPSGSTLEKSEVL